MNHLSRDPLIADINQPHLRTCTYIKVMRYVDHKYYVSRKEIGEKRKRKMNEREQEREGEGEKDLRGCAPCTRHIA